MKKLLSIILICCLIMVEIPIQAVQEKNNNWEILNYALKDSLQTTEEIIIYTGDRETRVHSDMPKEGYQYLILEAEIEVSKGGEIFELDKLKANVDNNLYDRISGSFLEKHKYKPITNKQIVSGVQTGNIVFEIPNEASAEEILICYEDKEIALKDIQNEKKNIGIIENTNIQIEESNAMDVQKESESHIKEMLRINQYTIQNPYIIQDPYNKAPLTALVGFNTEKIAKVTVEVKGKNEYGNVKYTIPGESKEHLVPIVGLYPEYENIVTITAEEISGNKLTKEIKLTTPELPEDMYDLELDVMNFEKGEEHFTHIGAVNGYNTVIDVNGDIRWYYSESLNFGFTYLENGHFIVLNLEHPYSASDASINQKSKLYEIDMLGKIYKIYNIDDRIHHDFKYIGDNKLFFTGHNQYSTGVEDTLYLLDLNVGEITEVIDYNNILDRYRYVLEAPNSHDWLHINSIAYNDSEDSIIVSGRRQGVIKIDKNRELEWILAPHDYWTEEYKEYLLTPVNDMGQPLYDLNTEEGKDLANKEFFPWAQHAVELLPDLDNNPLTDEIILFNNGNERSYVNPIADDKNESEGVIYSINSLDKTVKILRRYGRELGKEFFSGSVSDANLLSNNNMLIASGDLLAGEYSGHIVEVNENNEIIWSIKEKRKTETRLFDVDQVEIYPPNYVYDIDIENKLYEVKTKINAVGILEDKAYKYVDQNMEIEYQMYSEDKIYISGEIEDITFNRQKGYLLMYDEMDQYDIYGYVLGEESKISQVIDLEQKQYKYMRYVIVDDVEKLVYQSPKTMLDKNKDKLQVSKEQLIENKCIAYYIERAKIVDNVLDLGGWAIIKNLPSEGLQKKIIFNGKKNKFINSTNQYSRTDVTKHFNYENDYDYSGFATTIDLNQLPDDYYTIGIQITTPKESYYVETPYFVEIQKEKVNIPNKNIIIDQENISKILGTTPNEPQIVIDPYNMSPLTAILRLQTNRPAQASILVKGKENGVPIKHSFEQYEINHEIPIYGLYADYKNEIVLTLKYENGKIEQKTFYIQTQPLPKDMINIDVRVADDTEMQEGLTFVASKYVAATDSKGNIRWYLSDDQIGAGATPIKRLQNGNLLISSNRNVRSMYYQTGFYEIDLFGRVHNEYVVQGTHHEIQELSNGNFLVAAEKNDHTTEDYIVEIDRKTGKVLREWDLGEILGIKKIADKTYQNRTYMDRELMMKGASQKEIKEEAQHISTHDWLHNNAFDYIEQEDAIIISARQQDMVFKIDAKTGKIRWILSDIEDDFPVHLQDKLLTPTGEEFEWQYGQHAVIQLPNGDIMLYDNGNFRSKDIKNALKPNENYSRAVIYRVNEQTMTVEQVWQYGKERGSELYTPYIGDVDYLNENHYLINFGGIITDAKGQRYDSPVDLFATEGLKGEAVVIEIKDNKIVYEIKITNVFNASTYRVERLPLYYEGEGYVVLNIEPQRLGSLRPTNTVKKSLPEPTVFSYDVKKVIDEGDRILLDVTIPETLGSEKFYIVLQGDNKEYIYDTHNTSNDISIGIHKNGLDKGTYNIGILIENTNGESSYTETQYQFEVK